MTKKRTAAPGVTGSAASDGGAGPAYHFYPQYSLQSAICQPLSSILDSVLAGEEQHAELALHYARLMLQHATARDAARRLRAVLECFIPQETHNEHN